MEGRAAASENNADRSDASDNCPIGGICFYGLRILDPCSEIWCWPDLGNNHFTFQVFLTEIICGSPPRGWL